MVAGPMLVEGGGMGPTGVGGGVTVMGGTRACALLGAGGGITFAGGTRGCVLLGGARGRSHDGGHEVRAWLVC